MAPLLPSCTGKPVSSSTPNSSTSNRAPSLRVAVLKWPEMSRRARRVDREVACRVDVLVHRQVGEVVRVGEDLEVDLGVAQTRPRSPDCTRPNIGYVADVAAHGQGALREVRGELAEEAARRQVQLRDGQRLGHALAGRVDPAVDVPHPVPRRLTDDGHRAVAAALTLVLGVARDGRRVEQLRSVLAEPGVRAAVLGAGGKEAAVGGAKLPVGQRVAVGDGQPAVGDHVRLGEQLGERRRLGPAVAVAGARRRGCPRRRAGR